MTTEQSSAPDHADAEDRVVDVQGLGKRFGATVALRNVDLHAAPGEIVALV